MNLRELGWVIKRAWGTEREDVAAIVLRESRRTPIRDMNERRGLTAAERAFVEGRGPCPMCHAQGQDD